MISRDGIVRAGRAHDAQALTKVPAEAEKQDILKSFQKWQRRYPFSGDWKHMKRALKQNRIDIIRALVLTGKGEALLHDVIEKGDDIHAALHLIGAGVDINAQYKRTAPLVAAAAFNRTGITKLLISEGAALNIRSARHNTPLVCAARNGHINTVALLLEAGADINLQGEYERTALIWAATKGHRDIAKLLTEHNADPHFVGGKSARRTARKWAAHNGFHKTCAILTAYEQTWVASQNNPRSLPAPAEPKNAGQDSPFSAHGYATSQWSIIDSGDVQMAIQTIYDPQSGTQIKNAFDFTAERLLTEFTSAGQPPSLSDKPFKALKTEFLEQAQDAFIRQQAKKSSVQNIKLT